MNNYQINQNLSDAKSGNYLIQVTKIGDKRRSKFLSLFIFNIMLSPFLLVNLFNIQIKYQNGCIMQMLFLA